MRDLYFAEVDLFTKTMCRRIPKEVSWNAFIQTVSVRLCTFECLRRASARATRYPQVFMKHAVISPGI